jgi:hypothetical protein
MAIKKKEFYEGAALLILASCGEDVCVRYESPFYVLNNNSYIYLKYSTKGRSPWGFTFTHIEQASLRDKSTNSKVVIGLICGMDGIAALHYSEYQRIAAMRTATIHISCYRLHGEHYEVNGPDGTLGNKVAPSNWRNILKQ